ncbi:hypothetical protein KUF89_06005 [Streptococcus equi subsp. zooepidemicus]|uniref:hypothetical protein n=1 Tax=Streptococcus equi TaxID=1336 RepID=UPI001E42BAA4|nr:hypothetical protein [Streptococcus equi]MCD3380759.1 hypothetical protein [Streptococcus equi subsp. zooepidemicus]HEL1154637.1 hypothetical protein [Streptococcus equi subsp. zooepidemicus]
MDFSEIIVPNRHELLAAAISIGVITISSKPIKTGIAKASPHKKWSKEKPSSFIPLA